MTARIVLLFLFPGLALIAGLAFFSACSGELPVKEEEVAAGDVTLFVRTAGNAARSPALLAVNGGPGQSSHYMRSLEQLAGGDLAVVTFDQRGCGRSTGGKKGYALPLYIEDMEAIRRHLGKEKVILFGHSFGGVLALRYASRHPERVAEIILMASGPPARELITKARRRVGERVRELVREGVLSGDPPQEPAELIRYMMPAYFSDPAFPIPDEIRAATVHPEVGHHTLSESGDWDFRPGMAAVTCPVLFVWGEDDPFGIPVADQTKNALQNARLTEVIIRDCGHFWQERPEPFFTAIRDFLASGE